MIGQSSESSRKNLVEDDILQAGVTDNSLCLSQQTNRLKTRNNNYYYFYG